MVCAPQEEQTYTSFCFAMLLPTLPCRQEIRWLHDDRHNILQKSLFVELEKGRSAPAPKGATRALVALEKVLI